MKKVFISRQVHDELIKLANKYSPKIICGFLVGKREEDRIIVEEHYVLPTSSGPKIHFKPNWSAYHSTADIIHEQRKTIVGEFHTHPDGSEQLNINDRKILRKLGGGFWIIATPNKIVPWHFRVSYEKHKREIFEKLELHIT